MTLRTPALLTLLATLAPTSVAYARPVVLELYTSQGCSSCPPADALLRELAKSPDVLALSFHVHYWDYLGWHDPFAAEQNTKRQYQYAHSLHQNSVFTPQMVVDGSFSAVGSERGEVGDAIARAHKDMTDIPITFTTDTTRRMLNIHIAAGKNTGKDAGVYAVRYRKHTSTDVTSGENSGHTLNTVNSVLEMTRLGTLEPHESDFHFPLPESHSDGIAILVQNDNAGPILSAGSYAN